MSNRVDALVEAIGLNVSPGGRVSGFLPVDGFSHLDVPVAIVRGGEHGPVAVVIAGVHGGEYNGIEAARRLAHDLDPAGMSGTVAIVPLANRAAFHARSHNGAPPDGQNLARVFPGSPDGRAIERVAHAITSRLILHADLLLDLHGADALEDLTPHLYIPPLEATNDRPWSGWDLAEAYGIELVELVPPGKLAGSAASAGAAVGIPAILPEAGAFGHITEDAVRVHYDGILNVFKRVGILEGTPTPARRARRVRHDRIHSPASGCFYSEVRAGHHVTKGQVLGKVTDYFGQSSTPVHAPSSGEVDFVKYSLATNKGDSLYLIAVDLGTGP